MRNVLKAAKNVAAFIVTIFVGAVIGTALFTVDTYDDLETDVKRRIERHRTPAIADHGARGPPTRRTREGPALSPPAHEDSLKSATASEPEPQPAADLETTHGQVLGCTLEV